MATTTVIAYGVAQRETSSVTGLWMSSTTIAANANTRLIDPPSELRPLLARWVVP